MRPNWRGHSSAPPSRRATWALDSLSLVAMSQTSSSRWKASFRMGPRRKMGKWRQVSYLEPGNWLCGGDSFSVCKQDVEIALWLNSKGKGHFGVENVKSYVPCFRFWAEDTCKQPGDSISVSLLRLVPLFPGQADARAGLLLSYRWLLLRDEVSISHFANSYSVTDTFNPSVFICWIVGVRYLSVYAHLIGENYKNITFNMSLYNVSMCFF